MKKRFIIAMILATIVIAGARAQVLERQAIVPAGATSSLPGGRISSTSGEIASAHLGAGATTLTQGFQQPYFQFGRLAVEDFSGNAGDSKEMRVTLALAGGENPASTAIRMKLRFNATLLAPMSATSGATILEDSITDGMRTIEILLPLHPFLPSPLTLTTLNFKVGLGNDSASALEIIDAAPVDGPMRIESSAGRFTLLGICREGGPRLVNPIERARIAFKPNPVTSLLELEFEIHEHAEARVTLVDLYGREVRRLVDESLDAGTYNVTSDMTSVPSGTYTLVLSTDAEHLTRSLVIAH
jgi:hypothetical protein